MIKLKTIIPDDLVCMDDLSHIHVFRVDLAYARPDNLLFGERIYKEGSKLYLHKDLANIVRHAAEICLKHHKLRYILYDGLRTTDAQTRMIETQRVKDNPHWLEEPRLLSPPGAGGHPRGMAIDIGLENLDGELLDMGSPFDFLAINPHPDHNPAHRSYTYLEPQAQKNRWYLDTTMQEAATFLGTPLLSLPEEWWDFRLPSAVFSQYAPLSDKDLPAPMQLI